MAAPLRLLLLLLLLLMRLSLLLLLLQLLVGWAALGQAWGSAKGLAAAPR